MSRDDDEGLMPIARIIVLVILGLLVLWALLSLFGGAGEQACPPEALKCDVGPCKCCVKDGFGNLIPYCDTKKCGPGYVLNSQGQCCSVNDFTKCLKPSDVCVTPEVCSGTQPCCPGYTCSPEGKCIPCSVGLLCNPSDVNSCCAGLACNSNGRCEPLVCALKECPVTGKQCQVCDDTGNCVSCIDNSVCTFSQQLNKKVCISSCAGAPCSPDKPCCQSSPFCVNGLCSKCAAGQKECDTQLCASGCCDAITGECICEGKACALDSDCCSASKYCVNGKCSKCPAGQRECDTQKCASGCCDAVTGECACGGLVCSSDNDCCKLAPHCVDGKCSECPAGQVPCQTCKGGCCLKSGGCPLCDGKTCAKAEDCCESSPFCNNGACVQCPPGQHKCDSSMCATGCCADGANTCASCISKACSTDADCNCPDAPFCVNSICRKEPPGTTTDSSCPDGYRKPDGTCYFCSEQLCFGPAQCCPSAPYCVTKTSKNQFGITLTMKYCSKCPSGQVTCSSCPGGCCNPDGTCPSCKDAKCSGAADCCPAAPYCVDSKCSPCPPSSIFCTNCKGGCCDLLGECITLPACLMLPCTSDEGCCPASPYCVAGSCKQCPQGQHPCSQSVCPTGCCLDIDNSCPLKSPEICLDCKIMCSTQAAVYDLNGDGVLDALDLKLFDDYIASSGGQYDRRYDFNNDRKVDAADRQCLGEACSGGCRVLNISSVKTCINIKSYTPEARQALGTQVRDNVSKAFNFIGYAVKYPEYAAGFSALKQQVILQVGTSQGQSFVECASSSCKSVFTSGMVGGVVSCKLYTLAKCNSFSYCDEKNKNYNKNACDECKSKGKDICDAMSTSLTGRCEADWIKKMRKDCAGDYKKCISKEYTVGWCDYTKSDTLSTCKSIVEKEAPYLISVCEEVVVPYESGWCKSTVGNCIDTLSQPLLVVERGDPFIYGSGNIIQKRYFSGCAYFADPYGGRIKVMELERQPACSDELKPSVAASLDMLVGDACVDLFAGCVSEKLPTETENDGLWKLGCIFSGGASCGQEPYCIENGKTYNKTKCDECLSKVGAGCTYLKEHAVKYAQSKVLELSSLCTAGYISCTQPSPWCENLGNVVAKNCNDMIKNGEIDPHLQQVCDVLISPLVKGKCSGAFNECYTSTETFRNLVRQLVLRDSVEMLDRGTGVASRLTSQEVSSLPIVQGDDCPYGKLTK
ncbi:MAG: dockerin type I domain-containing protein [Candidatus Micrarchaeota archaeon]|nr:dockerin type I domain-containing protein [Candidatus Micrarchaeota archaeon]